MKQFIFLFAILIQVSAFAQSRYHKFFQIDPTGSYNNASGYGEHNAPTRIDLAAEGIVPGDLIKLDRVGQFIGYNGSPNSFFLCVFVDANENYHYLHWGTNSVAVTESVTYDDVADDFQGGGEPYSSLGRVQVPVGAVALLFTTSSAYATENTDPDGDFGVWITKLVPSANISQFGVQNPGTGPNDDIINLNGGANAEIKATVYLTQDLGNSTVTWTNDATGATTSFSPTDPPGYFDVLGNVTFNIQVPFGENFSGLNTVVITVRNSSNSVLYTFERKVDVTSLVDFQYDIYQVIKNPIIYPPSTVVDLVAGKNADIIVSTVSSLDLTKSEVTFSSTAGTSKVYSADSTATSDGVVTFRIDPVPAENFLSGQTHVRIQLKDSSQNLIAQKIFEVKIRKTKPIQLGFVPIAIAECGQFIPSCYAPGSKDKAKELANIGIPLIKVLFPVASSDVSAALFRDVNKFGEPAAGEVGWVEDYKSMYRRKDLFRNQIANSIVTHQVGVVDRSYFIYHGKPDTLGLAYIGGVVDDVQYNSLFISTNPITLPHELAHVFTLGHVESGDITGYSNYDTQVFDGNGTNIFSLSRGFQMNQKNLMKTKVSTTDFLNFWLRPEQYLQLFEANLDDDTKKNRDEEVGVRVVSGFNSEGLLANTGVHFVKHLDSINNTDGDYLAIVRNFHRNEISRIRIGSAISTEDDSEILNFDVPTPGNAVFIDVYRLSAKTDQPIGTVVITADALNEDINYIPPQAFVGSQSLSRQKIQNVVAKYREYIVNQKLSLAQEMLNTELIPLINQNLTDNYTATSDLDVGKSLISQTAVTAVVRTHSLEQFNSEPGNAFINVNLLGSNLINQKSKIEINELTEPSNNQYKFVYDVWFDGLKNAVNVEGGKSVAYSPKLSAGNHQWVIQSYLVGRREDSAFQASISRYQSDKFSLEKALDFETDPDIRGQIMSKIIAISNKILLLQANRDQSRKIIGSEVELSLEVL